MASALGAEVRRSSSALPTGAAASRQRKRLTEGWTETEGRWAGKRGKEKKGTGTGGAQGPRATAEPKAMTTFKEKTAEGWLATLYLPLLRPTRINWTLP